ncbi:hypothetical protein [Arsenophonus sp.]|uniref:hypothetical protein n=1 Tax=Arsenophonus sp. TaxID=1872640 RepID=UPI003879E57C
MSNFDRKLQLELLELAVDSFPESIDVSKIPEHINALKKNDTMQLVKNIVYLQKENLLESCGVERVYSGWMIFLSDIKATEKAINLLSEEGSISASLKIVTVKIHDESLAVIREFIHHNVNDPEEKKRFLQQIKQLPADATKHIVLELLGKGLGQIPNAIQWLQTMLPSA